MRIIVSLDNKKLGLFLENRSEDYHYIYLGERNEEISRLLNERAFKEIEINSHDASFKDRFLKLYIDLVGKLGLKYSSIYWWATFTSSKNPFMSKLLPNLFVFYSLVNRLKENPEKNVLVINPPIGICGSIAKYCFMNSIELKILSASLYRLTEAMKQIIVSGISEVSFVYNTWKKIHISHKYLRNKLVSQDRQKGKYYVLRSWLYARSFDENNKYHDAFFGILPDYLVKKGQKLLIVGGLIGDYESIVKRIASNNEYLIIPQEYLIKYADPIKAVANTYLHKIRIREKLDLAGLEITDIVKSEIAESYKYTAGEYLHTYYIRRMLNLIDVDTFTTTYENNPWEKVCFYALKKYSPETKTIGYQHVPLSKVHLVMFMTEYEKEVIPLPDKINTIGKITKELLQKDGNYEESKLKVSCALRFQLLPASEMVRRNRSHRILVALRGFFPSVRLANFVYRGLKDNRQYKIIIRPHPALPYEQFKNRLIFDVSSSPNFSISDTTSVKKDLQEVDIVLYEGSAVAIEALAMGIPVIHVDLNDPVSWDYLFQCDYFSWVVNREKDLQEIIESIFSLNDDEYYGQQAKARQYIEDLVNEVTEQRLDEFII